MSRNENIQVFIRMKPHGDKRSSIDLISDREIGVRDKCGKKSLTFARIFAPTSNQHLIYETVARPLVNGILSGYSCTLFAYGQSGSGKTFTMLGEKSSGDNIRWENDALAGLIPRSLNQIFNEVDQMQNKVVVQISSIVVYNEELYDLLSSNEDIKLRIYDDASKKGSIVISGLEDVVVRNKDEALNYMERVFSKKETLTSSLNASTSRFHTIFTISVTINDNTIPGEECVLSGKLCLVDLGGSDNGKGTNPDKAGWDSSRVNLSLLTLGRVINSLFTHSSHIPYRESKLTRLLRDSLGGSSKTCIIACIKPFLSDVEETVNTLDLMNKAKMIVNQPQISKRDNVENLIEKYTNEIVRLRKDLEANKTQTGVYIDDDNYQEMEKKISTFQNSILELQKKLILSEQEAKKIMIERQVLSNNIVEKEQKIDELIENFVEPYNEAKNQLEKFRSLVGQSSTQNMKILDKVDQMRAAEQTNKMCKNRQMRRNAAKFADLKEKFKSYHNKRVQKGEQLTESVIRLTEKESNERSELLDSMLENARENNTKILTSCQKRLEKSGTGILRSSEKIDNCQSVIESMNANKQRLENFFNNEVENIVADSKLEHKFAEQQLKLKNLEETIKSSLGDISKSKDGSTAKLKEIITTTKLEITQMSQNLFLSNMENITTLRIENNKKLEQLGKQIAVDDELHGKQQECLHNMEKTKTLLNDLNITESISKNEKTKITAEGAFTKSIEKLDENLEMMNEFRRGFSEESKGVTERLKKESQEMKEKLSALSSAIENVKSQDRTAGCLRLVKNEVAELTSNSTNSLNEMKNALQENSINVETANLRKVIDKRYKENKENIGASLKKIQEYSDFNSEQSRKMDSNLKGQHRLHNSIFNGELKSYKATGETPQRQEYRFPEKLASMSPYERNKRNLNLQTNDEDDLTE